MKRIAFVDTEVSLESQKVKDYGAVGDDGMELHTTNSKRFEQFLVGYRFVCGHNIINHDAKYIRLELKNSSISFLIDTLFLSPLLFPKKPYHALVKDDKLQTEELNNPLNDAKKAKELFFDEVNSYKEFDEKLKQIFYSLLGERKEFKGFFEYLKENGILENISNIPELIILIKERFFGKICENANLDLLIDRYPMELSYCLSLISCDDRYSVIPHWVHVNFPAIEMVMHMLRGKPCEKGCSYCNGELDIHKRLKKIFGYDSFRNYDGEALQENAVTAAMAGESLLAIFPTGGGKSLTFQLPALIQGDLTRGLTVVISPLQSLMKDQVDNLTKKGIVDAVTINGMLSPIERAESFDRIENGLASIVYISPEQLRSKTIERLLMSRNVVRFVIDEAHCFSAWGQDFRVEYMYIGEFIREYCNKKNLEKAIPVSCFTATAKQKVVSDIVDYFKKELGIELKIFATNATRTNLRYEVIHQESEEQKYLTLRNLIESKKCPTIIYVSRTKKTFELAERLCKDGISAKPFNGKMESNEKSANQEAFIKDEIQVIVATSAFGMGVDKPNVKLVIHYDISDSLENYVQEAGRAGRDEKIQAECYVLYNDNDLDKHFILLNQTKLSISEIQQVWKAIKDLTGRQDVLRRSPLEIARQAGWDDNVTDIETRVKTAIQALENAGYIKRGQNVPRIYATSIIVPNMIEASARIDASVNMDEHIKKYAKRIIQMLLSKKSVANAGNDDSESRTDYIADRLGIERSDVLRAISLLRQDGLIADTKDLTAYIKKSDNTNKTLNILKKYINLECFLLQNLSGENTYLDLKVLNDKAINSGMTWSSVFAIKTILYFWTISHYIVKNINVAGDMYVYSPTMDFEAFKEKVDKRNDIAIFITGYLFQLSMQQNNIQNTTSETQLVTFSVLDLMNGFKKYRGTAITNNQIEDALLYLSKIDAIKLEGGFLVSYNSLEIRRLERDNKIRYKVDDYKQLNEHYQQKIQQIHIVGEFANMMVKDYNQALKFVSDYFQMDYKAFIRKYFKEERLQDIQRNITPAKYKKLFDQLSEQQRQIINDDKSQYIVVAAGPGSGKTRVLVHKLASLLLLEDVKHEQLLMLTFSRAAATEFKQRLFDLIGNAAAFVEIKTFHSYCFDLLGKIGNVETAENVVKEATELIQNREVEIGRITKNVVVIDEAQDMDKDEYDLICALMDRNEEMRVIAVGDDDQNIYEFRGSDSKYMQSLITEKGAVKYELVDNYRSDNAIVEFSNSYIKNVTNRMKVSPIRSVSKERGIVKLIRHEGHDLAGSISENIALAHYSGTVCVLTNTNDEALKVLGLLINRGIPAKLIQSNDGFALIDLIEIRFFLQTLDSYHNDSIPVIDDVTWTKVKDLTYDRYENSSNLPIIKNIIHDYEISYKQKYYSDLKQFIIESKLEDFYHFKKSEICVSTIHKSKGREFDKVYMLLDNEKAETDESKRKLYVGMTRAKKELHIHFNNDIFESVMCYGVQKYYDNNCYPASEKLISQLSHKDVFLGFYEGKQKSLVNLYGGMELVIQKNGLAYCEMRNDKEEFIPVVQYSQKYLQQINHYEKLGYYPVSARIRFVVAWKNKTTQKTNVVILPDITFRKR
ncbi:MAG: RecQ family ATP-dependent DNA helicase [Lachnospira sp.]